MSKIQLTVLSIRLREDTVVRRMGPRKYMDGIVDLLRTKRTGTLFIDGWEPSPPGKFFAWERRAPIHVCMEDVRTFEEKHKVLGIYDMTDEGKPDLRALNRNSKGVLKKAWMPRCERA